MLKSIILKTSNESLLHKWKISRSFRVLVIPGHTKVEEAKKEVRRVKNKQAEPRYKRMTDADKWVDVWPTAKTFNYSVLPLPVRMGFIEGTENDGIIPSKYANAELMKIPNFLHLTPPHIKNHCQQIKKHCTPWPEALKEDALMQLTHFDYVRDAPSLKDERSRFVSVTVSISKLHLSKEAKEKFLRLTKRFCVRHQDLLIITSGKCPTKQQNYEYIRFLLSVLYKESLKKEEWEEGKEVQDMVQYKWKVNKSHENMQQWMQVLRRRDDVAMVDAVKAGEKGDAKDGKTDGAVEVVRKYGRSVEKLMNQQETLASVQQYKDNVKRLYSHVMPA